LHIFQSSDFIPTSSGLHLTSTNPTLMYDRCLEAKHTLVLTILRSFKRHGFLSVSQLDVFVAVKIHLCM